MKLDLKWFKIVTGLLLVALSAGTYFYWHRGEVTTDNAAIDGCTVVLSPKVSGYIKALNIKENQSVKAGDVLLEIDSADYTVRRNRAKATLASAQAAANAANNNVETTMVTAESNIDVATAQVASAEVVWEEAHSDRQRLESLFNAGACSRQQLEQAATAEKTAQFKLDEMRANLQSAKSAPTVIAAAKATSDQLQEQANQAKADLEQAEIDLVNTRVIAPMDGRITKCSVEVGTYVQTGQQLTTLVGAELWIVANFKENQLEHLHPGQSVDIHIDAFPNIKLHGKVDSIQAGTGAYFSLFPAENATGNFVKIVQRVPVKIMFESIPDDIQLGPGMSVVPTIYTRGGNRQ
ncbi:MAG TPA: HlyD family secretion protein [Syntrophomonadaceae bacterium]|nr:HlyD family secretion protein [Syntrophomonadaceae bacterium]